MIGTVSKTVVPFGVPRVRIPPPPSIGPDVANRPGTPGELRRPVDDKDVKAGTPQVDRFERLREPHRATKLVGSSDREDEASVPLPGNRLQQPFDATVDAWAARDILRKGCGAD